MTNRAVLGALPGGGGFGLYVSMPGYNVLTDDPNDVHKFSFNSNWSDMVRTWQVGFATASPVTFSNPGFIPHMEVRQVDLSTAYDDRPINWTGSSYSTMAICAVSTTQFTWSNVVAPASIFYVIFNESAQ